MTKNKVNRPVVFYQILIPKKIKNSKERIALTESISEVYLEHIQAPMMEFLGEIITVLRTFYYLRKVINLCMFNWVLNAALHLANFTKKERIVKIYQKICSVDQLWAAPLKLQR